VKTANNPSNKIWSSVIKRASTVVLVLRRIKYSKGAKSSFMVIHVLSSWRGEGGHSNLGICLFDFHTNGCLLNCVKRKRNVIGLV
jgi:hypothetical protein